MNGLTNLEKIISEMRDPSKLKVKKWQRVITIYDMNLFKRLAKRLNVKRTYKSSSGCSY